MARAVKKAWEKLPSNNQIILLFPFPHSGARAKKVVNCRIQNFCQKNPLNSASEKKATRKILLALSQLHRNEKSPCPGFADCTSIYKGQERREAAAPKKSFVVGR